MSQLLVRVRDQVSSGIFSKIPEQLGVLDFEKGGDIKIVNVSEELELAKSFDIKEYDTVSSHLFHQNLLYLGFNSGIVKKIDLWDESSPELNVETVDRFDISDELKLWDAFGCRGQYENDKRIVQGIKDGKFQGDLSEIVADFEGRCSKAILDPRGILEYHAMVCGLRSINGFLPYEGEVFDASFLGLRSFESGDAYTTQSIMAVTDFNGIHCFVPGIRDFEQELMREKWQEFNPTGSSSLNYKPGYLYSVESGSEVISKFPLMPLDGSGYKPGEFILGGDNRVYMQHGDTPEFLTIREAVPPFREINKKMIDGRRPMVRHGTSVLEFASNELGDNQLIDVLTGEEFYETAHPFTVGEDSAGRKYIGAKFKGNTRIFPFDSDGSTYVDINVHVDLL